MKYDLIVIGSGPAGLMCAIQAAQRKLKTLIIEQLPTLAAKLKATGGGRCNLTNTLDNNSFISKFGRQHRWMLNAINLFDHHSLITFFNQLEVDTHAPDGIKVFPTTHKSDTIVNALIKKAKKENITILTNTKLTDILIQNKHIVGIKTQSNHYQCTNVTLATGGLGYPHLGSTGEGFKLAKKVGHSITSLYPAMLPLKTQEKWVAHCTADTIAKATIKINKKIIANGDLIFTKTGLRGPAILDCSREITPLLATQQKVNLLINLTKGLNEEEIAQQLNKHQLANKNATVLDSIKTMLPNSVAKELCKLSGCNSQKRLTKQTGKHKIALFKILTWTPLTIIGHDGFAKAMITRGGINLKEVDCNTMQSKLIKGLFFCGEILDLDGPCGGYNLGWCFTSGYTAGISINP